MKALAATLAGLILALQYPLWFGKGGWLKVRELDRQVADQQEANGRLRARNEALDAEVKRITDMGVTLQLNAKVDDIEKTMQEGGFDATFLAVG